MRIGLHPRTGDDLGGFALAAEEAGLFGVLVDDPAAPVTAPFASAATRAVRVVVRTVLGPENPVTLAEELAVLDHLSGGRVVALVDTGELDATEAAEDLRLLRAAWSGRFVRHQGVRWQVPAGVVGPDLPTVVSVTPKPAQIDVPVWLDGAAADELSTATGLPRLAREPGQASERVQVQPAYDVATGDLDTDREKVLAWAAAGVTHLMLGLPAAATIAAVRGHLGRYLQPEVSMPVFPRFMAELELTLPWPGR